MKIQESKKQHSRYDFQQECPSTISKLIPKLPKEKMGENVVQSMKRDEKNG